MDCYHTPRGGRSLTPALQLNPAQSRVSRYGSRQILEPSQRNLQPNMNAFTPSTGLCHFFASGCRGNHQSYSRFQGTSVSATVPSTSLRIPRASAATAFPYTGSGYGSAGVPYAQNTYGYKATTTVDIVATAVQVPILSTLVSLLQETGLDYELQKAGPFTVFAPTNIAFSNLLEPHAFTKFAGLLRPENREELKKLLAYHVIRGRISTANIGDAGQIAGESLAAVPLTVMGYNKRVTAGSAPVIKADVPCSNGIIHVIGSVLVPPTFVEQPKGIPKKKYFQATVLDIYKNTLTPTQALGIDPVPDDYDKTALAKLS